MRAPRHLQPKALAATVAAREAELGGPAFRVVVDNRRDSTLTPLFDGFTTGLHRNAADSLLSSVWNDLCGHSTGRGWRARLISPEGVVSTIDDGPC